MAYASRAGRARTNARSPEAHAICQRCGFRYNHVDLRYQWDWAGAKLQNLRILVCQRCYDCPQEQNRAIVIPADPVPITNPSPEFYVYDETAGLGDFGGDFSNDFFTNPVIGPPSGIDPNAQMPLVMGQRWAVPLNILSILANGSSTITVNTNGPHGLATNAQVSVEGLTNPAACAAASIIVVTATQFTYTVLTAIPTASLANNRTRVITLNVGLPYGVATIPQTGTT